MGRQVEGNRKALLSALERLTIEAVALLGGREPGILADGPGPVGVHRRAYAARERLDARYRAIRAEIDRIDVQPAIVAPKRVEWRAAQLLLRDMGPDVARSSGHHTASNSMITASTASTSPAAALTFATRAR